MFSPDSTVLTRDNLQIIIKKHTRKILVTSVMQLPYMVMRCVIVKARIESTKSAHRNESFEQFLEGPNKNKVQRPLHWRRGSSDGPKRHSYHKRVNKTKTKKQRMATALPAFPVGCIRDRPKTTAGHIR